eukprot:TRINITY_DN2359_c0_g1_i4.p2 TRINITY_DN2359_c0_g1~~TRINITY_DN2359_c0_g1_i4.p2  ORF type:complete len:113 (-),score=26.92 TRINITY_DN2359_c0_g1_i4:66-404(-)
MTVRKFSDDVLEKSSIVINVTRLMMLSIVGTIIFIVGLIVIAIPNTTIATLLCGWSLIWFGLNFSSTAQILTFNPKVESKKSSPKESHSEINTNRMSIEDGIKNEEEKPNDG